MPNPKPKTITIDLSKAEPAPLKWAGLERWSDGKMYFVPKWWKPGVAMALDGPAIRKGG